MTSRARFSIWIKAVQAVGLAVAVYFTMGAAEPSSRFNSLSHQLMCTCSCSELLGECNHVGCPDSPKELDELHSLIDAGHSDKEILTLFSAKYGATVLAAPTTEGFNLVAWIAPFAVFGAALLGTILLVRRWANVSIGKTQAVLAGVESGDDADRERRETIRRETGDGGF
jgi:cytochrome c-type biogenesis protein CcmH